MLNLQKCMEGSKKMIYLTDYLQKIRESVKYKKWFFGHIHINEDFKEENAIGIYEQIIRIA